MRKPTKRQVIALLLILCTLGAQLFIFSNSLKGGEESAKQSGAVVEVVRPSVEQILPAVKDFDYAAKYQSGGARELCPAPITAEQQEEMGGLALKLHRALGLEVYSRTDFLMDAEGNFWCLEVNSLPGMTSASLVPKEAAAIGMSYNELCEEIVQQSYRLKRRG